MFSFFVVLQCANNTYWLSKHRQLLVHAILNVSILVALREVSRGRPKQVELVTCLLTSHFSPPGVEPGEQVCEQCSANVCIFAGLKIGEMKNYFWGFLLRCLFSDDFLPDLIRKVLHGCVFKRSDCQKKPLWDRDQVQRRLYIGSFNLQSRWGNLSLIDATSTRLTSPNMLSWILNWNEPLCVLVLAFLDLFCSCWVSRDEVFLF